MTKVKISFITSLFLGIICYKRKKYFRRRNYKKTFLRIIVIIIFFGVMLGITLKNTIETKEVFIVENEVLLLKEEPPTEETIEPPKEEEPLTEEAELPTEAVEPPTEVVEPSTEVANIDEENLYWLAHGLYGENGHMSYKCQLYTGLVIFNRWKDPDFPSTVKEVLFADGQYAIVNNGRIYNEPSEEAWQLARDILSGNTEKIPENVVYQAGFSQGSGVFAIVDGEYFCYK